MAILNYPSSIGYDTDVNPGWIEFSIYERKSPKDSFPLSTINLYLPESMRNPNTISWGNDSLGMLGHGVTQLAQGNVGRDSFSADSILDGIKRMGYTFAGNAASSVITAAGGSASTDAIIGAATGQVRNPYLTALFRGVDFRTFEMVFKFSPFQEKDCDTIDQIIKQFRGAALPPGKSASATAFLGYPNEFEIRYIWRGRENKYLHKFKRCVLTGIDVDYTGMGMWAAMRNGFPAESNLVLRFSEIEIVLRDDVQQENY